jgi:hypothetical protein
MLVTTGVGAVNIGHLVRAELANARRPKSVSCSERITSALKWAVEKHCPKGFLKFVLQNPEPKLRELLTLSSRASFPNTPA